MAESPGRPRHWLEVIAVVAILSVILLVRGYQLGSDPPPGLSASTDAYTDPPQYTLFAKLFVQTGEFNPFNDYRLIFFLKSSVTYFATVVYSLFGVTLTTMGVIGLCFSLAALLLFFLFVRRLAGREAALLFLLLAGLNFNLVAYGRLPFLEHPMVAFVFAALVLVSYFKHPLIHLAAGLVFAVGVFFGKVMGIAFLAPFACYYAFRLFRDDHRFPRLTLPAPILFSAGFLVLMALWYSFAYHPFSEQVTGYLQEQSLSLYGAPEAFESVDMFLYKFVTFGADTELFSRMPLIGLLGAIVLAMIILTLTRRDFWTGAPTWLNAGHIFIAATIVAFYCGLMIWNYRPLRYQLVLIYPFCAFAAVALVSFWQGYARQSEQKYRWWAYAILYPLVAVTLYQVGAAWLTLYDTNLYYKDIRWYLYPVAALVVAGLMLGNKYLPRREVKTRRVRLLPKIATVVVLAGSLTFSLIAYARWVPLMSFTARDMSLELDQLLSPEAVLSGPFGPLLTMQNDLPAIIHMFGVSSPDPDLFRKFPITHLLLDEGNESQAREDYPEMMNQALHIATYRVGRVKVKLLKIAGHTGNRRADAYPLSLMERAIMQSNLGNTKEALALAAQYGQLNQDNLTCNLFLAEQAELAEMWPNAEFLFKKAVEFSPTSYVLYARLGKFYASRFDALGNREDKQLGLAAYENALALAPDVYQIRADYNELLRK